MVGVVVILAAVSLAAALAGYVMWWASHRSTLVNVAVAMLLALLVMVGGMLIALAITRAYTRPLDPLQRGTLAHPSDRLCRTA
jgi:hypothetical protein